jgi:branched-subunit amino acid transport protein
MRSEILLLALIVGACTYGFRALPTRVDLASLRRSGPLARFLAATGPAAIATLFVAAILPAFSGSWQTQLPLAAGVCTVLGVFAASKSVVQATLAGSAAYGVAFALI